jgi:hypothetical protein
MYTTYSGIKSINFLPFLPWIKVERPCLFINIFNLLQHFMEFYEICIEYHTVNILQIAGIFVAWDLNPLFLYKKG